MARPKAGVQKEVKLRLQGRRSLLLAVSGGLDSMVMLHACHVLARPLKLRLEVAHIDHALRKGSAKDARFVELACEKLELPFHLTRLKKKPAKTNLEEWGRGQRYSFLERIRKKRKLELVATAHTANDVAETFLIRLVSNKELRGIEREDKARSLIRPLLSLPRETLEAYAAENKISFVQDPTNFDPGFLRNRVRLELVPLLKRKFDPRIIETLSARAEGVSEDLRALDSICVGALDAVSDKRWGSKEWSRALKALLERTQCELRWRVAERLLKDKLGFNLGRRHGNRFVEFVLNGLQRVELPGSLTISRKGGALVFNS